MQMYKNKSFVSKQDGLEIFYDVYIPEVPNATLIQIAHGMVEHKDRYEWVGSYLAECGFIVVINDHRGHGKSIDTLHPWGEMNGLDSKHIESSGFVKAIMDMHQLTLLAKEHFKPQKYVLLGHSMGSLLARGVVEAYKADKACQFVFSLESFIGLFKGMAWVNKANANQANMGQNLPLLITSGNKDSCGNFGIGVEKIANQYRLWGFDVRLKLYEGARHEILNETNKQEVIEDIVEFVGKNV